MLIDGSLKSLEQEFSSQFIRIHRNTLVALEYIPGLEKDKEGSPVIKLQGIETRLPVSRCHVRKVLKHV